MSNLTTANQHAIAATESIKKRLIDIGYQAEEQCAATTILVDNRIDHIAVNDSEVEIMPLQQALKQYPWVQDEMFGLIDPQAHEMIRQVADTTLPPLGYFVHVKPGASVTLPLQLFTVLETPQARQYIHNLMIIGEGARVDVMSGAVVPESLRQGKHVSITETYIHAGANYRSISVETWGKDMDVYNFSASRLEKGAREIEVGIMVADIKKHYAHSTVHLKENAVSSSNSVVFASRNTHREMHSTCVLAEAGAHAENITRMVADGGVIDNYNTLIGEAPNVNGYLGCDGLMLSEDGQISSTPQVTARTAQVNLSHEASIGVVGQDKLVYLMASGMTEDEARDLIVQGFLDLDRQRIPKGLRDMVKRMVETAKSGSM
uniref:SufD family Fe-S cluster assembly protein n=1 Tax=Castellaniella defragrans TaxID=75697 RepID=UPI00333F76FB